MALTVQSDEGDVANANAYISVAYFKSYFADRGIDIDDFDDDQISGAIVSATDYIDNRWSYRGERLEDEQTTEFPRDCLYNSKGVLVEGLPLNLKKATAEYARQACINGGELAAAAEGGAQITMKREKVGPIEEETQYSTAVAAVFKPYPIADVYLTAFRMGGFLTVYRA